MATRIDDDFMTTEFNGRVIATARYSADAAADGQDPWTVAGLPRRLFTRNQAITAMVLAERLAAGYGDDDLFVIGWREELAARDQRNTNGLQRQYFPKAPTWPAGPATNSTLSSP